MRIKVRGVDFSEKYIIIKPLKNNQINPRSRENDPQTCLKIPWKYGPVARHVLYPSGRITSENRPGCRPKIIFPEKCLGRDRGLHATVRDDTWGDKHGANLVVNPSGSLCGINNRRSEIRKTIYYITSYILYRPGKPPTFADPYANLTLA